ncbi:MAG: exosortase/archaeosortase family protein [Verrucomicrobia bacterium]|nr:exosortase/archaeosortase family protein [Verrucomicrobiota bacterium]
MKTLDERPHLALLTLVAGVVFAASPLEQDLGTDLLRAVAGLLLFHRFGGPWGGALEPATHRRWEGLSATLIAAQLALGAGSLGALGLAAAAWSWLRRRRSPEARNRAARLLPLLVLAMPWVAHETTELGWWFRLSGAWVTEQAFAAFGLAVTREGTLLNVEGTPISVEAACSGLQTLPAILLAGALLLALRVRTRRGLLLGLCMLPLLAWVANTVRIGVLSGLALSLGERTPTGTAHELIGLVVIAGVVGAVAALPLPRRQPPLRRGADAKGPDSLLAWLAAGAAVCALVPMAVHWLHAPLERHSWLIFVLWFAPVLLRGPGPARPAGAGRRARLAGASLALTLLGLALGVHALALFGAPFAAAAFLDGRWRLAPWIISAFAWMPAAGWALHALPPTVSLGLRLLLAGAGAASVLWLEFREGRRA